MKAFDEHYLKVEEFRSKLQLFGCYACHYHNLIEKKAKKESKTVYKYLKGLTTDLTKLAEELNIPYNKKETLKN